MSPRGGQRRAVPSTGLSPALGCPDSFPFPSPHAGITRFDLLGDFGRFDWLGNFYLIFLYNMGFAGLTTLCLVKRVSWAAQAELLRAFGEGGGVGTSPRGVVCGCPPPALVSRSPLRPGLHKLPLPVTCRRPLGQPS